MTTQNSEIRRKYQTDGYALVESIAPAVLCERMLAMIHRDMTSRSGGLRNFVSTPRVNVMPAYEFYGYRYLPVMGFHWGLTSRISDLTGKRLAPTYAFFRVYPKGDRCLVHSDRESCEHSFSMPLAYSDDIVWPFEVDQTRYEDRIAMDMPKREDFEDAPTRSLMMKPGDAVLYHGVQFRHGRTIPNPNRWSAHLFLHWVDLDGPYSDWAFDRQKLPPRAGDFEFSPAPAE